MAGERTYFWSHVYLYTGFVKKCSRNEGMEKQCISHVRCYLSDLATWSLVMQATKYRVRTNYWTISLDHILSWKCAIILKFVSNTAQWTYIWNGLNAAKAITWEKHTSLFDKMAALSTECSWCVLEFARSNSVVTVQRAFRQQFGRCGSPASSVRRWYEQFRDRGCICRERRKRLEMWPAGS
jgi:hypothetical protein